MNFYSHLTNSNKREDYVSKHSSMSTIDMQPRSPINSRLYLVPNRQQLKYSSICNISTSLQTQNKSILQEIQYLLNQLNILNQRMDKKWQRSQSDIEQIYRNFKQIQKQLVDLIKQEFSNSDTKEFVKIIGQKLHQLHINMYQQLNFSNQNLKKMYQKNNKQTQNIQNFIKIEQKQSEKCWQQKIDVLATQILQIQNLIYQNKLESEERHKIFQEQIWKAEQHLKDMMQKQKKQTQSEHEIIIKLIQNSCNNLLLL